MLRNYCFVDADDVVEFYKSEMSILSDLFPSSTYYHDDAAGLLVYWIFLCITVLGLCKCSHSGKMLLNW